MPGKDVEKQKQRLARLSKRNRLWLESFESHIVSNLSNKDLSVKMLATLLSMSESTLLRTVKRLTGLTPQAYIIEYRLSEARRLLESGELQWVSEVAATVGYCDARSFSRTFKKRFGWVPSATK